MDQVWTSIRTANSGPQEGAAGAAGRSSGSSELGRLTVGDFFLSVGMEDLPPNNPFSQVRSGPGIARLVWAAGSGGELDAWAAKLAGMFVAPPPPPPPFLPLPLPWRQRQQEQAWPQRGVFSMRHSWRWTEAATQGSPAAAPCLRSPCCYASTCSPWQQQACAAHVEYLPTGCITGTAEVGGTIAGSWDGCAEMLQVRQEAEMPSGQNLPQTSCVQPLLRILPTTRDLLRALSVNALLIQLSWQQWSHRPVQYSLCLEYEVLQLWLEEMNDAVVCIRQSVAALHARPDNTSFTL